LRCSTHGHAHTQVRATHDRLRDIAAEITVIHRRVERLEQLGASNAGVAKEIDHLLTRVAPIDCGVAVCMAVKADLPKRAES